MAQRIAHGRGRSSLRHPAEERDPRQLQRPLRQVMHAAMTSEAFSVELAETCVGAGLRRHDVAERRGRRLSGSAPFGARNAVGASRGTRIA